MLALSRRGRRFTDDQIVVVMHECGAGIKVADLVRRHGVTGQTLYRWKKKYGGMQTSDAARMRALEEENRQPKRFVADQAHNLQVVRDLLGKSSDRRAVADGGHDGAAADPERSEPQAWQYLVCERSNQRYRRRHVLRKAVRKRLQTLAILRPRWGYRRLHRLLRRDGWTLECKTTQRLYK